MILDEAEQVDADEDASQGMPSAPCAASRRSSWAAGTGARRGRVRGAAPRRCCTETLARAAQPTPCPTSGLTGAERPTGGARGQGRELAARRRGRRNQTDPDSRLMRAPSGWVQGYNAQVAVDDGQLEAGRRQRARRGPLEAWELHRELRIASRRYTAWLSDRG
ncbi:MAG: hypothetical protein M3O73_08975 [Actinomycetota bacterium]|nr:hypothetical protein [Actinomycetota bacterium]